MCMIQDKNRVLVIDRKDKNWPGVTFPGGHIEFGESFTDAIIREVKEETGLHIFSPKLCGIKNWMEDNIRHVVLLYKTSHFDGELQSSDEGKVSWQEIDNLRNLKLATDMIALFRIFNEDDLSEFIYRLDRDKWIYDLK